MNDDRTRHGAPAPKSPTAFSPVKAPSPMLPKGGGAIRGIGETGHVSPATGTFSFEVPLDLTPGRQGLGPSLSLSYDSGAGNGPVGVGWRLAVPAISRRTDRGIPEYNDIDATDTFLLAGFEDLVPCLRPDGKPDVVETPEYVLTRYRPRIEGPFARIERRWRKTGGEAGWRVITLDNITQVYGETAAARIVNPDVPKLIYSWLLERVEDDRGNVVLYEYKAEDLTAVPWRACEESRLKGRLHFTNRYLKRIRYGNTVPFSRTGTSSTLEVVLDYGEHDPEQPTPEPAPGRAWPVRKDALSWNRAGFEIRTNRLCRRVLMFHRFPELGSEPALVRSVDFGYDEDPAMTRLTSITHKGYERLPGNTGAYSVKALPPLELGYTRVNLRRELKRLNPKGDDGLSGRRLGPHQWVDKDGEGLPGLLTQEGGALFYRRNEGGGHIAPPRRLHTQPTMAAGGMTAQMIDLAGSGQMALVRYAPPAAGYHEHTDEDGWGPFVPFAAQPIVDWNDPHLRFIDINGDGLDDLILVGETTYIWYPSLGKGGFGPPRTFRRGLDSERGPTVVFAAADYTVFLADMTGSGLKDIVRIQNGLTCYWPNLGQGKFGAEVAMSSSPRFGRRSEFDARRIRLGDLDGSGTTDLIYVGGDGGVRVWINQAGNSYSEEHKLHVYPEAMAEVQVLDLLGTGTACLMWSSPLRDAIRYVDLCGGEKPHLLTSIKNNMGLEIRLKYAPSTKFYLADRAAGRPWFTKLPFPVHVVERVESYDHVSRVRKVSEYRYHHGYYDGEDREFRGFGMVEQVDTEAFSAARGKGLFPEVQPQNGELPQPPVLTKTWFHTGAWRRGAAISRQYEKEYYAGDDQASLLPDTILDAGLPVEERKQACRALRGQMLRQEIYALDVSPQEPHPYSVVENSFSVRREQPDRGKAPAVFFVGPREAITWHYERFRDAAGQADPRTTHAFTLEVDGYGTIRKSVVVAYPRRLAPEDQDHAAQRQLAATLTETDVLHLADAPDGYRLGIPIESRTYELRGVPAPQGVFSFDQIATAVTQADARPRSYEHELDPSEVPDKRLIEQLRLRYYDSASLPNPLEAGDADLVALPYESYLLALMPGLIADKFNDTQQRVTPAILAEGGYVQLEGDLVWWIPSGRQVFDPAKFYLPTSYIDPFNTTSVVEYDAHALLVTRTEDALGNEVVVENDYRTLSPVLITDPNGNRAAVRLDELGMVVATAIMGKAGSTDGDTLEDPTTTLEYDLFRFQTTGKPNFVRTRARETHGDPMTRWQESYSYSDGSGQEVMRKVQAEPGPAPVLDLDGHLALGPDGQPVLDEASPRWVGTARTVFDNKGNAIKQYEPYFSRTHEYEDDDDLVHWGVTPILHYDPLGRLVRTDFPNGSCARVDFTPWTQTRWDPNDSVLDPGNLWYAARQMEATPTPTAAEQRAATLAAAHAGTPAVVELDPLGRPFLSIADLGDDHKVRTRTTLDIEGNPLVITDARGNVAMTHSFDVAGRKIHQDSIDAGARWMLTDVLGNPLRLWDSRGHVVRTAYDVLRRPIELWVQKDGGAERLAERMVYGEAHAQALALNLRGRAYQQYDGAGLVTNEAFDFKGNLLASSRKLAQEYKLDLDWAEDPAPALEAETFTTTTAYDALNRPVSITKPDQSEIRPVYNEAGLLETVDVRIRGAVAWTPFVTEIDYNEKGQRLAITYGNGVLTEYTYDPWTFRLSRLKTTRPSDGAVLQDLRYTFDPVGNIVEIQDHAQQSEFFGSPPVPGGGRYVYDAIYRLIEAEGREHPGQQPTHEEIPRQSIPHPNDIEALRSYTEIYEYDDVGNILRMAHEAGPGSWTRRYKIAENSNRLIGTSLPGDQEGQYSATYTYDVHGNMTSMPHLASIGWDSKDQKREVDLGGGGKAYYVYNAAGERVRKVWEHSGIIEERVYLGGYEVYRRREGAQAELVLERETLHVMDDTRRIAFVETKTVDTSVPPFTPMPRLRYQFGNHLGSAMLELDQNGLVISYEEYHSYGTTAYHAARSGVEVSAKRYRYTGKERDDETGLYYHGARYYAAWLGRWTSADPAGMVDGPNLYEYVRGNPVRLHDPNGQQTTDEQVAQMTDVQLHRHLAGLSAEARASFAGSATGKFAQRAWATINRAGMGIGYTFPSDTLVAAPPREASTHEGGLTFPEERTVATAPPQGEPRFWGRVDKSRAAQVHRALVTSLANIPNTLVAGLTYIGLGVTGHVNAEAGDMDDTARQVLAETEAWRIQPRPGTERLAQAYDVVLPLVVGELVPGGKSPRPYPGAALAETKKTVPVLGTEALDTVATAKVAATEAAKAASTEALGLQTAEQAGISPLDAARIQAVANKTGARVTVVGSRAGGTATPWSDWDYIIEGNAKARSYGRWKLPRGVSGGEYDSRGLGTGIDIFTDPLDRTRPHVIFEPKK